MLGIGQQIERALVAGSRAHCSIETRNGFGVVVKHVGLGVEDDAQWFFQTLKVGNQHLDAAVRHESANLADGLGKNLRSADIVVIAIYAGHDCML